MVRVCRSALGGSVSITDEAILHAQLRHPELKSLVGIEDSIAATVEKPDIVVKGKYGESIALRHLLEVSPARKYLVVPYEEGGEVKTAFITSNPEKIRRRELQWRRS